MEWKLHCGKKNYYFYYNYMLLDVVNGQKQTNKKN